MTRSTTQIQRRNGVSGALAACLLSAAALPGYAQSINLGSPHADASAPLTAPQPSAQPMSESVAAKVNDDVISSYDVKQRMRLLVATTGVQPTAENIPQIERDTMRALVDERLEMEEVKEIEAKQKDLKLEPTEAEVDQTIGDLAKQSGVTRQQLVATLKGDGVEVSTLREQVHAQMSWNHYIGARFHDAVAIGDNQVKAAVEQAEAASLKPQYQMAEIFIDASHVGGQQAAEDGAKQLINQMQQGVPFSAVARQFSALPTAAAGGDVGWVGTADLKPEVRAAVEQMRAGQLSQPIPVAGGVYIVTLKQKREGADAVVVDLKQVAISLPATASNADAAKAEKTLRTLRAHINGCAGMEEAAQKSPSVVAGDLGETEVKDLRPSFQAAIRGLRVDEVSEPIRTDVGLHLIAVCSRRASGAQTASKEDISDRLRGEQLSMFARRFLRDLRNSATIETR